MSWSNSSWDMMKSSVFIFLQIGLALCINDCPSTTSPLELLHRLTKWIEASGGSVSPEVELAQIGHPVNGIGVVAKMDLPVNYSVARIPLRTMINIEHALVSELNNDGQLEHLNDLDALALFLCHEVSRGNASRWDAFFATWPEELTSFPLFLSKKQLEVVESRDARLHADMIRFINTVTTRFVSIKHTSCSLEEFKRYISLLRSRLFSVMVYGGGQWHKTFSLVPFADLFNTGNHTNCDCITNKASTHLECFLTAPVARGDELLAPYVHPHSMEFTQDGDMNRFWWLHYGFTFKHEEDRKENSVHNLRLELEVQPLSD